METKPNFPVDFADGSKPLDGDAMGVSGECPADKVVSSPVRQPVRKRSNGRDERRRRRFAIKSNVQVLRWDHAYAGPDIAPLEDANADGILFTTDRDYPVGAALLVRFPYPGYNSPQQPGRVVRVGMLPDGRRRVAVALK